MKTRRKPVGVDVLVNNAGTQVLRASGEMKLRISVCFSRRIELRQTGRRLSNISNRLQESMQRRGSMKKSFMRGTWQKSRAFSPAVITEGGKVIWIAGHTGQKDPAGNSLAGDFDAQVRQTFKNIEATLKEAGASVKDIVTMTVFLADSRYTTRMTEIRTEIFGEDFPASAAITVTGFADPSMLIEIQGIAVVA
jgi:2-iminobutanoate/2-iminopropanoate deaminase